MEIQVYAQAANIIAENGIMNISLTNVDLCQFVAEIPVIDLLEAINNQGNYADILEFVTEAQKHKDDE